ncbi:hypothetical protein [Flavobacterium hydatis]|nr:hypothetical protein [Flavobacterium hydatis]
MKNLLFCLAALFMLGQSIFSQTSNDAPALGLPGDNLDLYAVLDLFQKSKTIEDFEKSLNEEKNKTNNLDLNLDKKVDFIKVISKKEGSSFTFVLQVPVSKTETQDVAVILVDKDKNGKTSLQIIGDEDLYGKNYVIEPKTTATAAITANPAYTGSNPVTENVSASQAVNVETVPVVQYIYSPAYVPYYPPYYYGYYPPYYVPYAVISIAIYRHHHFHHHHHYHGGHYGGKNTIVINNKNVYNNYKIDRSRSNTVIANRDSGKYRTDKTNNKLPARTTDQRDNNHNKGKDSQTRKYNQATNGSTKNQNRTQKVPALKGSSKTIAKKPLRAGL